MRKTQSKVALKLGAFREFTIDKELGQRDSLSTTLFNLVQEIILRESGLEVKGLKYGSKHQWLAAGNQWGNEQYRNRFHGDHRELPSTATFSQSGGYGGTP